VPRTSRCSLSLTSPTPPKPCMHLSRKRYMPPPPSHYSLFDHPNNIWWWVQIIKLLIT
jgi:hypothetical protein